MKKIILSVLVLLSSTLADQVDLNASSEKKSFKVVPLVTSNPTSGTGVGGVGSYIYQIDPDSSTSQLMAGGQYTNTDSWSVFAVNRAYFWGDKVQSVTGFSYAYNKSQFDLSLDEMGLGGMDFPMITDEDIRFDVDVIVAGQLLLYEVIEDFFVGGHLFYVNQKFSNPNDLGALFIVANGMKDSSRGAFGVDLSYDTRTRNEKYFPRDSTWVSLNLTSFPSAWGSEETYYSAVLNARNYRQGFNEEDVWANQFYGKYTSADAPDGGLAALGSHKILRGFPVGKYKARFLSTFQTEYRYQITETKYKVVAFAGVANLSGGSKGTELGNRDHDNGTYYSGGVGVRYAIQPKAGIDLRVDAVTNSDNEHSLYIGLNQSF